MNLRLDKGGTKRYRKQESKACMTGISIGVDIEDIERFTKLDFNKDKLFFDRVYTQREMEYCLSKSNPYQHLAARFAGKEAVIKAISGFGEKINMNEVELLNDATGAPMVTMGNKKFSDIPITISLSHCSDKVIAFAVAAEVDNSEEAQYS